MSLGRCWQEVELQRHGLVWKCWQEAEFDRCVPVGYEVVGWRHRELVHVMVFLTLTVWLGGEGCLVVNIKASVEESTGADESDVVDRSCFGVRCWRGAIRPVLVYRIKGRIAEQIVNILVPRMIWSQRDATGTRYGWHCGTVR